ncbi:MAG: type VI secretion system lipoprotein TssJ [Myxococcales bacterium]
MDAERLIFGELVGMLGGATAGAVLLSVLGACSHTSPPPAATPEPCASPESQRVSLAASASLNPGENGEALATVVRLYQIRSTGKLTGVSFDDLLDRDKDTLGEDLLGVQEVTLNPGEKLEQPVKRKPETAYLMAVALFRQPTGTTWRVVKKLAPPNPQHCHAPAKAPGANDTVRLYLEENRLELR